MKVRPMLPNIWSETGLDREPFRMLKREIDNLFSGFTSNGPVAGPLTGSGRLAIQVDIAETDKALEVTAEMPGVNEKDIDVSLAGDVLAIKPEKKSDKEEKTKDYHIVERSYGTFERSMRLPFKADPANVDAKFEKGVLRLIIQKPAEAQAKLQKIEVKTAA
jgi:HSP20 family protein